jgi:hypothetical protein
VVDYQRVYADYRKRGSNYRSFPPFIDTCIPVVVRWTANGRMRTLFIMGTIYPEECLAGNRKMKSTVDGRLNHLYGVIRKLLEYWCCHYRNWGVWNSFVGIGTRFHGTCINYASTNSMCWLTTACIKFSWFMVSLIIWTRVASSLMTVAQQLQDTSAG